MVKHNIKKCLNVLKTCLLDYESYMMRPSFIDLNHFEL